MKIWKKFAEKWDNSGHILLCCGIIFLLLFSCTIAPRIHNSKFPSFSGTNLNSGLLYFTNNHSAVINDKLLKKYYVLVDKYGNSFVPPIEKGEGITMLSSNLFIIDAEHLYYLATMNRWHKNKISLPAQ